MKICKIYIKGFQQFQDVELDFTNPETGEPLDKVCFIGSNGTGKTVLLSQIKTVLDEISDENRYVDYFPVRPLTIFEFSSQERFFYYIISVHQVSKYGIYSDSKIINSYEFSKIKTQGEIVSFLKELKKKHNKNDIDSIVGRLNNEKFLFISSPAESISNSSLLIEDVPATTVNAALLLKESFPKYPIVSSEKIDEFWKILVYNLRKRAEERDAYENLSHNLLKTKQQLIEEFDKLEPKILFYLNRVWEKVLDKAGLYFDLEGASNPFQLNDNLKAYVKLKSNNQIVPYNELSTGIRNYIFRIGHIFSLYFNREIDLGFLLVDEPENSLYPDFLFELVEIYQQIILDKRGQNNTQMFFATHNPIIAAQFKPYERIILDWNEDGTVRANKGITPEGDDPNDILIKDFGLHQLMGPVGIQQWNKYLELKKELKKVESIDEKMSVAAEINEIGRLYNFPG